jgi:hypothetical protein
VTSDYPLNYVNAPHFNPQQGYVPPPFYNPSAKLETVVEESPRSHRVDHLGRVNSAFALRPLTPAAEPLDAAEMKKLQQHRGSLSTAISQLGLETCQNAMVRQVCTFESSLLNSTNFRALARRSTKRVKPKSMFSARLPILSTRLVLIFYYAR